MPYSHLGFHVLENLGGLFIGSQQISPELTCTIIIIIPALLVAATVMREKCSKHLSEHKPCMMNSVLTAPFSAAKGGKQQFVDDKKKREDSPTATTFLKCPCAFSSSSLVPFQNLHQGRFLLMTVGKSHIMIVAFCRKPGKNPRLQGGQQTQRWHPAQRDQSSCPDMRQNLLCSALTIRAGFFLTSERPLSEILPNHHRGQWRQLRPGKTKFQDASKQRGTVSQAPLCGVQMQESSHCAQLF